jgi:hypothetical protein
LCRWMYDHFDDLEHPEHMHLIEKQALSCGSGYHLMFKIPPDMREKAVAIGKF